MTKHQILSVASEVFPLIKTGGLADVAGALPGALKPEHFETRTLIPGYPAVLAKLEHAEPIAELEEFFGGPARVLSACAKGLDLFVLDAPHLYRRDGGPYADPTGVDFTDNFLRFAALGRAGALLGQGLCQEFLPDVVHAHDWQAGLTAAYLKFSDGPKPKTVFTVHNLAFQGQFGPEIFPELDLPNEAFSIDNIEYYGGVGFLKAGLQLSDRLTTVSPSYAQEIQTFEAGMGLDGLLRARAQDLSGVLNGIDCAVWDPETDPLIAKNFSRKKILARAENKKALQQSLGLDQNPEKLLIGVVSRLSWQKGLDLLLENIGFFEDAQLALLGAGDRALEAGFVEAAQRHPGRIGVHIGYEEKLAHQIQAGADVILVPSRFEPCGLTQLCALRYGAVPLVARVGGLNDTIIDANEMALQSDCATGLQFAPPSAAALGAALRRAHILFQDQSSWKRIQANGMKTDVSWSFPARHYCALYRALLDEKLCA